jgi:hypothetical protein
MSQSRAGCLAKSYPEERISVWMGHLPSLPDSLAVIGPSRLSPDVVHAFGHGHVGMTGAPMTGKVIADLVSGRPPSMFPRSAPPGSRDPVASPSCVDSMRHALHTPALSVSGTRFFGDGGRAWSKGTARGAGHPGRKGKLADRGVVMSYSAVWKYFAVEGIGS